MRGNEKTNDVRSCVTCSFSASIEAMSFLISTVLKPLFLACSLSLCDSLKSSIQASYWTRKKTYIIRIHYTPQMIESWCRVMWEQYLKPWILWFIPLLSFSTYWLRSVCIRESCLSIFWGVSRPPTSKDILEPSHGRVICVKFGSVYVVKGVSNLLTDLLFDRPTLNKILESDWKVLTYSYDSLMN